MPVLILTARDRWSDKVQVDFGRSGADDYVAKPLSQLRRFWREIRALLRRRYRPLPQTN